MESAQHINYMYAGSNTPNGNGLNSIFPWMAVDEDGVDAEESDAHLPGSSLELTNFNPERPMIRIETNQSKQRFGPELNLDDRYQLVSYSVIALF